MQGLSPIDVKTAARQDWGPDAGLVFWRAAEAQAIAERACRSHLMWPSASSVSEKPDTGAPSYSILTAPQPCRLKLPFDEERDQEQHE